MSLTSYLKNKIPILKYGILSSDTFKSFDLEEDSKKISELTFKLSTIYSERGLKHYFSGDYKSAIEDLIKSINFNPKNVEAYNDIGIIYGEIGKYELAVEYLNKAVEIDPCFTTAHENLKIARELKDEFK